jgi:exodeoxyribonuclease VII large subunit
MYNQKKFFSNQSNRPRPTQNNNQADLPVLTVSQFIDDTRKKIQAFGFYRIRGQLIDPKLINGSHFFASLRDEKDECRIPIKVRDIHQIKFDRSLLSDNAAGTLVEVTGKTDIFKRRGEYYLQPTRIDNIGLGELYANTERLKAQLQKEGLFDPNRKKPLPFLPHTVGLITGKDSKGKDDVIKNVQRRWPGIRFITKEVTVDGTVPTKDMFNAIESLANDRSIDVIVIARGGGDPQGMIMFNDEKLVREIARCTKPIISAIGHETDHHLIDYVADVAASTPTDVAR